MSFASEARREAAEVLDERRFRGTDLPRPLEDPIERLGAVLDDAFAWVAGLLPGGRTSAWGLVLLGVLALGAVLASVTARRAARAQAQREAAARAARDDPAALLRAAEDAERAGDLAAALRLRFRAGLLDLDARGALDLRPATSTREIARQLRSPTFDGLAGTFDEVVYGGRPAQAGDVADAREGWPRVRRETEAAR